MNPPRAGFAITPLEEGPHLEPGKAGSTVCAGGSTRFGNGVG